MITIDPPTNSDDNSSNPSPEQLSSQPPSVSSPVGPVSNPSPMTPAGSLQPPPVNSQARPPIDVTAIYGQAMVPAANQAQVNAAAASQKPYTLIGLAIMSTLIIIGGALDVLSIFRSPLTALYGVGAIAVGVGLLRRNSVARLVAIVVSVITLVLIARSLYMLLTIQRELGLFLLARSYWPVLLASTVFSVWVIVYLNLSHVKAAFN